MLSARSEAWDECDRIEISIIKEIFSAQGKAFSVPRGTVINQGPVSNENL